MGTIYKQTERDYRQVTDDHVSEFFKRFSISDCTTSEVLKIIEILEYKRRTDFLIDNGDRWDEQMEGIARCIDKISDAIWKNA